MLTLGLLLTGCSVQKDSRAQPQNDFNRDTAYVLFDTATERSFEVDLNAIAMVVQNHINQLRQFDTVPTLAQIDTILSEADETCPTYFTNGETPYWADQCTSEAGAEFQGYGTSIHLEDELQDDGSTVSGSYYYGEGQISSSTGLTIQIEGGIVGTDTLAEDGTYFYTRTLDGAVYNAQESNWTSWDYGPQFQLTGAFRPETGLKLFFGAAALETETTAVFIDELVMVVSSYGLCEDEPGANIQVFTEDSGWLDIAFNGPTFETWDSDMAECDGCGQVSQFGEHLGDICIDFSDLMNWEINPWTE